MQKVTLVMHIMQHHTCSNWQKVPTWPAKTLSHLQPTILAALKIPTTRPCHNGFVGTQLLRRHSTLSHFGEHSRVVLARVGETLNHMLGRVGETLNHMLGRAVLQGILKVCQFLSISDVSAIMNRDVELLPK